MSTSCAQIHYELFTPCDCNQLLPRIPIADVFRFSRFFCIARHIDNENAKIAPTKMIVAQGEFSATQRATTRKRTRQAWGMDGQQYDDHSGIAADKPNVT